MRRTAPFTTTCFVTWFVNASKAELLHILLFLLFFYIHKKGGPISLRRFCHSLENVDKY